MRRAERQGVSCVSLAVRGVVLRGGGEEVGAREEEMVVRLDAARGRVSRAGGHCSG